MKPKKLAMYAILISLALPGVYTIFRYYFDLPEDNPVEEHVENVIEISTGLEIELTP